MAHINSWLTNTLRPYFGLQLIEEIGIRLKYEVAISSVWMVIAFENVSRLVSMLIRNLMWRYRHEMFCYLKLCTF